MDEGSSSSANNEISTDQQSQEDDDFKVLPYSEKVPMGYSLTTCTLAQENFNEVMLAYKKCFSVDPNKPPNVRPKGVRLKDGLLRPQGEFRDGSQDKILSKSVSKLERDEAKARHQDKVDYQSVSNSELGEIKVGYQEKIRFKLVSKSKLGLKDQTLESEGQLIALAYAAEHDDVEEVKELASRSGGRLKLLRTNMPFASMGTILHFCLQWASLETLTYLVTEVPKPESFNVRATDKYGDTALHNLPNNVPVAKSYEFCEKAAHLLLDMHGPQHANALLAVRNNYGHLTALCKALAYEKEDVCQALLDAAKKVEEKTAPAASRQEVQVAAEDVEPTTRAAARQPSDHWLAVSAHGWRIADAYGLGERGFDPHTSRYIDNLYCTALHLAVLRQYPNIVGQILTYPGAPSLTILADHNFNTPLHVAARIGDIAICSMLLKHDVDGKSVRSHNEEGENPLHIAAIHGHADVCEKLLEYGASLSEPDKHDRYALTNALAKNKNEAVMKLLDACIPPTYQADSIQPLAAGSSDQPSTRNPNPKESLINVHFGSGLTPLHVAVAISSTSHISHLIKAGALVYLKSSDRRTPLHLAAERHDINSLEMLLGAEETSDWTAERKKLWINAKDVQGHTALHMVLRSEHSSGSSSQRESSRQVEEITEEGVGNQAKTVMDMVMKLLKEGAWVDVQDHRGQTPLHAAVRAQKQAVVRTLVSFATHSSFQAGGMKVDENRDKWICMCDFLGETALHAAARKGDVETVRLLLDKSKSPDDLLRVRDMTSKTALDWAALHQNGKEMISTMIDDSKIIKPLTKDFLLWHLKDHMQSDLHAQYYETQYGVKKINPSKLLEAAIGEENVNLASELINRGAEVIPLNHDSRHWLAQNLGRSGSDRPTSKDFLGRKELVQGVATLLLNPYTQTPVTIGLFGSWGTGKSSILLQVERAMLWMVAKETFKQAPSSTSLGQETSMIKFSENGLRLRHKVEKSLKQRMKQNHTINKCVCREITLAKLFKSTKETIHNANIKRVLREINLAKTFKSIKKTIQNPISKSVCREITLDKSFKAMKKTIQNATNKGVWRDITLLKPFKSVIKTIQNAICKPKRSLKEDKDFITSFPLELLFDHHQFFKSLALIDRSKLVQSDNGAQVKKKTNTYKGASKDAYLIAYTPAVLTLHYNAWQYNDKNEASAGLAVEITQQLENFMTPPQWLKMCWKSSWRHQPRRIALQFFYPTFLTLFALCVFLLMWFLLPIVRKSPYLSIPMVVVSVALTFFRTCLQVIQPMTKSMLENSHLVDHQSMLGYQHHVIEDIKFLKGQLCKDPHYGWKILGILCCLFMSNSYFMEGTWIQKQHPSLNNFRIVVFIDDLDRCDEKTILELLRAINLILGACEINVVIGVDKDMVHRAIIKEFVKDVDNKAFDIWEEKERSLEGDHDLVLWVDKKESPNEVSNLVENINLREVKKETNSNSEPSGMKNIGNSKFSYTRELAENYLQKIIQLPIQIPDPSTKHIEHFLREQVGQPSMPRLQKDSVEQSKIRPQESRKNGQVAIEQDGGKEHSSESKIPSNIEIDDQKKENEENPEIQEDIEAQEKVERKMDEENPKSQDIKDNDNEVKVDQMKDNENLRSQDGASDSIAFQLILANYTPNEMDLLTKLCQLAAKERRVPREWKRFLNYHRLAWTILSQDKSMRNIELNGWQRKLFLWIFICWNWRAQMDVIFKNWRFLTLKSIMRQSQAILPKKNLTSDTSLNLSDIIVAHAESNKWNIIETMAYNENKQGTKEAPKSWKDLYTTLREEYDIPMPFIDKFQQFRFYCLLNHLEISNSIV